MALAALLPPRPALAAVARVAELRHVEYRGDGIARLRLQVYEKEGEVRYPISTVDRSMIDVGIVRAADLDVEVGSLTTVGTAPGETQRALVVVFNGGLMRSHEAAGLRAAVADLLPSLPAAHLAVAAFGSEGAREITESVPGSAENVVRVQRDVLSDEPEGEGPRRPAALCYAADRFASWDLSDLSPGDQKAVLIVGARGDGRRLARDAAPDTPARDCGAELAAQGVSVYDVGWLDNAGASVAASGGFAQRVKGAQDAAPALINIAANLNGEYLVDVELPLVPMEAQPLGLEAVVRYHDDGLRSGIKRLPRVFDELSPPPPPPPVEEQVVETGAFGLPRWLVATLAGLLVVASAVGIAFRVAKRMRTTGCNACGRRVQKTHQDCPFRDKKVVARLVVLEGKHAGQTLPLKTGDNIIARGPWASVPVAGKGVGWRRHATVRIEGMKALYIPGRRRLVHRVNGWPVAEPRLLGSGHVLQVGQRKLRFEVRPDAWRSA